MDDHFMRPDNDQEPAPAEFAALADEYQAGLDKCAATGYEEYGPDFRIRQRMVVTALRAYSGTDRERFEEIIASLNYDGADENSLTVGEIRRALA